MRIERNNKNEYSTKLYKYLAIISITIITILVGMITHPSTTVSAVTYNVHNITVEKVPIRLYYDSYRAATKIHINQPYGITQEHMSPLHRIRLMG